MQVVAQLIFSIVLVVGIVGCILGSKYLRILRENQGEIRTLEKQFGNRLARVEMLEERINVLEKIVTDSKYDLHKQFRDLEKAG